MREEREAPRRIDQPLEGFFLRRLTRGGPWVGCAIVQTGAGWRAQIDGRWCGEAHPDPAVAPGVMDIWTSGRRVDETEFRFRLGLKAWAEKHAPLHPAANPREPVNLLTTPTPF
jgi:hypothetical protein